MLTNVDSDVALATHVLDRVFVPIDYSMSSHRALGVALELMQTHGSSVCVFHVQEGSASDAFLAGIGSPAVNHDWTARAEARLRRFLENIAPEAAGRVEVMAKMNSGARADVICSAAQEWNATLIIASARVKALLGSHKSKLLSKTTLPVLMLDDERDHAEPEPVVAPIDRVSTVEEAVEQLWPQAISMGLGIWLAVSAFMWPHAYVERTSGFLVGVFATAVAIAAAFWVPKARYINAALGGWLVVSAFAVPSLVRASFWNHIMVGVLLFVLSLVTIKERSSPKPAWR